MDIKNTDVKEKLDKGLISEYEAEVMDSFHSIEARDQILSEESLMKPLKMKLWNG